MGVDGWGISCALSTLTCAGGEGDRAAAGCGLLEARGNAVESDVLERNPHPEIEDR